MDTAASSAEDLKDKIFRMPNGTWHGYNFTNGDATTWSLALDRFVDPIWLLKNRTTTRDLESDDRSAERERPILFRNETGIDVGPTTLLFEAYAADFSLYYLQDPTLRGMKSDDRAFMKSYTAEHCRSV
ncbi:hypothetical protein K4K58_003039 [Colletotrichum sp. SAR11_239]|nr:hypothetical protein K4K58_003039 [Colletotrichum sp. SAR11_239]